MFIRISSVAGFFWVLLASFALNADTGFERNPGLTGGENFRDYGHYQTESGEWVKQGLLFRSNDLSRLTENDQQFLKKLDIRTIVDFRSEPERAKSPSTLASDHSPEVVLHPISSKDLNLSAEHQLEQMLVSGKTSLAELDSGMREFYSQIPLMKKNVYIDIFNDLSNPNSLPMLVHCTAGKDRTGIAAALVLSFLGVPREVVIDDYLLTNRYPLSIDLALPGIPKEIVKHLAGVEREWIEATFNAIETEYGSLENYFSRGLGITKEQQEKITENLLTDVSPIPMTQSTSVQK